jgi:hypothetical protein
MDLIPVLKDYLDAENTDYALLISGEWGCGKTYFLKKELFKTIRTSKVHYDLNGKNHEVSCDPVYVSLFGIKETSEIDKRVFLELNPSFKSKPAFLINLLANKLGGLIKISSFKKEDLKDYLSVFNIPQNKILCFDDLERIHEDVLEETLGYINSFVEHQNVKVIIVGDENILRTKVKEYDKTKEKLIRFTYSYSPDINQIFDSFLEAYSKKYKEFLTQNKDFICAIFIKGQHRNLRTLRFSLDLLKKVFETLKSLNIDSKHESEILDRLTFFTTTFSIEYKKNNDRALLTELQEINSQNILLASLPGLDSLLGKKKTEVIDLDKISYKDKFLKMYLPFDNHYFNYFEVIANLAYTGFLDVKKLSSDISDMTAELTQKETTQEAILIQKMFDCFILTDDEFNPLITEVLQKVENGLFDLPTYPNLFTRLMQIEHYSLEGFKIDEVLIEKFLKGIDISKKRAKYIDAYRWKIPLWDAPEPRYSRISEYAIKANESLLYANVKSYAQEILLLIENNDRDELYKRIVNSQFLNLPVFSYIDPVALFDRLIKTDNLLKYNFSNGLYERYKHNHSSESYKKELNFFTGLLELLNKHIANQKVIKISTVAFVEIRKVINSIVEKTES